MEQKNNYIKYILVDFYFFKIKETLFFFTIKIRINNYIQEKIFIEEIPRN